LITKHEYPLLFSFTPILFPQDIEYIPLDLTLISQSIYHKLIATNKKTIPILSGMSNNNNRDEVILMPQSVFLIERSIYILQKFLESAESILGSVQGCPLTHN
jgi:hypothetical protein